MRCAKRAADGYFALTGDRPRQHQIGDVGANNEESEQTHGGNDAAEEMRPRALPDAERGRGIWCDLNRRQGLGLHVFRHDIEFGLNLRHGCARRHLSDDGDVVEGAVEEPAIIPAQAGIGGDGHADFEIGRELRAAKTLGGNSHDGSGQSTY
jgi:hypothetical protein